MSNPPDKAIFMHIHKCLGTSFIEFLKPYSNCRVCVARPGDFGNRTGRELIPDPEWHSSFKFTFVRNPYDRAVSAYHMFQHRFPTFREFIRFLSKVDVRKHRVTHTMPIKQYVHTEDCIVHHCSAYTNPKYLLTEMDFTGKLESLQTDFDVIRRRIGSGTQTLPHRNKTKHKNYVEYYDNETQRIVADVYAADFAYCGYDIAL